MRKRTGIIAFAALFAAATVATSAISTGAGQAGAPDDALKTPRLATLPDLKMLVVEAKGDPNTASPAAFGLLFKTFFSLPGVRMAAPRARWSGDTSGPKDQWIGYYALPLPESVTGLPAGLQGIRIEVWKYGEVAEILHVGPYSEEPPAIEKLHAFIAENGRVIAGLHEEEYLVGPGMGAQPAQFRTIIRYPVKKK